MKINKKLSAAITLSLMLGVYGSASALNQVYIYGVDGTSGSVSLTDCNDVSRSILAEKGSVSDSSGGYNQQHVFTVNEGQWFEITGSDVSFANNVEVKDNSVTLTGAASTNGITGAHVHGSNATVQGNTVTISGDASIYSTSFGLGKIIGGSSKGGDLRPE